MFARDCTDQAEWDEFVRRIPWATVHHGYAYGRLLASCFGFLRQTYRLIESGGRAIAAVPLMRFSLGRICCSLQSLPFDIYGGPLLDPEHAEDPDLHRAVARDVAALAGRLGAFEVRVSIPVSAPRAVWSCVEELGPIERSVSDCPLLDLDLSLDEVRRGYRPELRRALRKSTRDGVVVEPAAIEDVRPLYPIYRARMNEIGATVKPWRFVEGILAQGIGVAFVARQRERAVGFLILLATPGIAIYWISAIAPEASSARPMNALLDAAIAWSHARGIARFSFGESHGRHGLARFKQGFGPTAGHHMIAVRGYRPAIQWTWRWLEPAARRTATTLEHWRASVVSSGSAPRAVSGGTAPAARAGVPAECVAALAGRRVLVTGATGFVGQHAVRALLAGSDVPVRILARSRERVREVFGAAADALDVRVGDLTDAASLAGVCDGVDAVIHSGSAVPYAFVGSAPAGEFARVNLAGTEQLAAEAVRSGVRRWVQVSSTAAMGTPRERTVDENTPCRPKSAYQISKRASEQLLLALHQRGEIEVAIVRPCLVAGEGKRGGEFLRLFRLCSRGVFPVVGGLLDIEKPLVAVDDVVQALLLAAVRGPSGGVYLVHSGGGHTLGDILREVARLVGRRRAYRSIPLPLARGAAQLGSWASGVTGRSLPLTVERLDLFLLDRHVVIEKAEQELGYRPRHRDLGEMLGRTYAYYAGTGQL